MVARPPGQAIAPDEQLDVVEGELRIACRESGGAIVLVLEQLRLQVEGEKVAYLGAALKCQAAGGSALECAPLVIHQGELAARVGAEHLGTIYRKKRDKPRLRGAARGLNTQACQLDFELFHQSTEDGLEVAPRVEAACIVTSDLLDGAGNDPRRLYAAQGLGVQEDPVGQSRSHESLEVVIDGVAELREAAPALEGHVGAISR